MFSVVLSGPGGPAPVGKPAPVEVKIVNVGSGEALCVGVLDGSEDGLRYPHYRAAVTRSGAVVSSRPPAEDPLVGPLREEDFVRLAPGGSFDPVGRLPIMTFANFAPTEPGVYLYTLTLSTESPSPSHWLGTMGQDETRDAVLELVARVPRVTVSADPLDIEFR